MVLTDRLPRHKRKRFSATRRNDDEIGHYSRRAVPGNYIVASVNEALCCMPQSIEIHYNSPNLWTKTNWSLLRQTVHNVRAHWDTV